MRIILPITPQPFVHVTPAIIKSFRIPERCRYIPTYGRHWQLKDGPFEDMDVRITGCELYNNTGLCRHTASLYTRRKRKQVRRYYKYKQSIKELCAQAGFTLQKRGWSIYFYFPIPERWSKKKKEMMRGQCKESKPDIDNMEKAIYDALGKKRGDGSDLMPDEMVSQLSGIGKFWMYDTEATEGYIEILTEQPLYNPFNVTFINQ